MGKLFEYRNIEGNKEITTNSGDKKVLVIRYTKKYGICAFVKGVGLVHLFNPNDSEEHMGKDEDFFLNEIINKLNS